MDLKNFPSYCFYSCIQLGKLERQITDASNINSVQALLKIVSWLCLPCLLQYTWKSRIIRYTNNAEP